MPAARPFRSLGATDFIMGSVLASVLFVTTACGGAPAPAAAPASSTAGQSATANATPAQSQSASPASSPTASPTPSAEDAAPLDAAVVPDAGEADLASNVQPPFAAKALEVLETLAVKGRAPKTGYDRAEFGQAWADVDRNGCDTRNDMLGRDLTAKAFKPGTRDCLVLTGILADPYTATTIDFVRGSATSSAVQIDHVVALNDAWQKGAQQLTVAQRTAFANDPLNLLAVDGPSNQSKGAGDAATWLPPNKGYRCDYVARQISVKATYTLWVTQAEHDAMARVLENCADVAVPTNQTPPPVEHVVLPPPAPIEAPAEAPAEAAVEAPVEAAPPAAPAAPAPLVEAPAPDAYYQNCSAVRAAGAAPILAGQPGFQSKFDGDGDGVGCE
ncbi:MAG: GmrSD restriction endonuclease domain-containing protein [Specibacter sp.]